MRATVMHGAGDVRIETVPDARLVEPTDALVVVTRAAICGSDLWPYKSMEPDEAGRRMGHEFIGVVEAVGADVRTVKAGDLVVAPFLWSDGTCVFCREGLHTSCLHGGRYGFDGVDGGQGEAVRVPQADGTLVVLPVDRDDALMPSLLTLSDVMGTGHHAALAAQGRPRQERRRRRRRRRRSLRRGRREAARRRADHHPRPPPGPDRAWRRSSARPPSSASAATRPSSAFVSSPAASASTPSSSASASRSRRSRLSASPVRAVRSAVSGFRRRRRSPRRYRPSSTTSRSAEDRRRRAPTSRSCCRTSSRAGSSPDASSIGSSASTRCPTATGR